MSFGGFNPNECGDANPNLRLAEHFSRDQAHRDARLIPQQPRMNAEEFVRDFLEESTRDNFQSYRADELLREVMEMEGYVYSPTVNTAPPNVTPGRDWFFNQPPRPLPPRPFFPHPVPYPTLPPAPYYPCDNTFRPVYPAYPMLPPHMAHPLPPLPGCYYPENVMPVYPRSEFRPVQATLEDLGLGDRPDARDVEEASRFFSGNEEGTSTDNAVGGVTEDEQKETETNSDEEKEDSEQNAEGPKPNTPEEETSGFYRSQNDNNSKYVELLKKSQVLLSDEASSEAMTDRIGRVTLADLANLNPSGARYEDDSPGSEDPESENFPETFLKKFADLLKFLDKSIKYQFQEDNPMLGVEDPFEEGLKRLEVGDIPSAVLCFEAAVQQESENALAWQYLGTTQAANEHDVSAISALKECLRCRPDNLTALMALAVSYTNENYANLAVIMLWTWLYNNPKYTDIVANSPPESSSNFFTHLDPETHKKVKDFFIIAANRNPNENLDPDVQCALGVLFNLRGDCDRASDCFRAALSVAPEDAMLWNRLGATLANGQRSEEAVEAYYRSLSLNPGYVRARYNLAVSCINLGAHGAAMKHLLKALKLQANTNNTMGVAGSMSETILITVKILLGQMGRQDMLPAVRNGDLKTLIQEFGCIEEIGPDIEPGES